jgi:hypothetical protein
MTMRFAILLTAAVLWLIWVVPGFAHSWYSEKVDPVYKAPCCGGNDCAMLKIDPGVLSAEEGGYRIRLTPEQANKINRYTLMPLDALVTWDRVQPSEDGNWHICIMSYSRAGERGGIYCLFAPPNI